MHQIGYKLMRYYRRKPIIAISARVFFPARVPIFEFRAVSSITTKNVTLTGHRLSYVYSLEASISNKYILVLKNGLET